MALLFRLTAGWCGVVETGPSFTIDSRRDPSDAAKAFHAEAARQGVGGIVMEARTYDGESDLTVVDVRDAVEACESPREIVTMLQFLHPMIDGAVAAYGPTLQFETIGQVVAWAIEARDAIVERIT